MRLSQMLPAQHCFYNVRGCPAVHCLADNSASWLVCADTLPDVTRLERSLSSYWNRLRLERPDVIEGDCLLPEISVRNKTVFYAGKRICLLYDDRWGNKISGVPVLLIICMFLTVIREICRNSFPCLK